MTRIARTESGRTFVEVVMAVAVIAILLSLMFPVFSYIQGKGRQIACLSNMRQVGGVILQYSALNDNRILPAVSGKTAWMDEDTWYEILDAEGLLPGNPYNLRNAGLKLWGGDPGGIMTCPARSHPANPYWTVGRHDLHYAMNQNPGFLNRVNTTTGPWPTLERVIRPSQTFMLAESSSFLTSHAGDNYEYPHPNNSRGMNLIFFDGHAEYYEGPLPRLPGGNFLTVPYEQIPPEESFPHF